MGFNEDAKREAGEAHAMEAGAEPRPNVQVREQNVLAMAEVRAWFGESGIEIPHMKASGWTNVTSEGPAFRVDLTWSIEGCDYKAHYHVDPIMGDTVTLVGSIKIGDSWYGIGGYEVPKPWYQNKPRPRVKLAIGRALLAHEQ